MNQKGIKFIHERTGQMAVNSVEKAAEVIQHSIQKCRAHSFDSDYIETLEFARNLAWIIGFDTLIEDRKAIREFTDKIVEDDA